MVSNGIDLAGAVWHKSSFSTTENCVEVAELGSRLAVRDSKNPAEGVLVFAAAEWDTFIQGVRAGEFS